MDLTACFPDAALSLLHTLESLGHSAWFVGGCVRDALLGHQPDDFDMATSATPGEVRALPYTTIPTGLKHGTVTVWAGSYRVEVTTYRADGPYQDGRRPDSVRFSMRIEDDLIRRDFTVNAMALHPRRGLLDIVGGQADLVNRLIRCVGNPAARLSEDALRILRAVRFGSALGFVLEAETLRAMRACAPSLARIAAERVFVELSKLLLGPFAGQTLQNYAFLLPFCLPVDTQAVQNVENWRSLDTLPAVLASRFAFLCRLLYHDETLVRSGCDMLRRLKASNDLTAHVKRLLSLFSQPLPHDALSMRHWLSQCGPAIVQEHLVLRRAAQPDPPDGWIRACSLWESEKDSCTSLAQLAVSGADLLVLGYTPGRTLGLALRQLLEAVMEDRCPNQKQSLLRCAKDLLDGGFRGFIK